MIGALSFEFPLGLLLGLPMALAVALAVWRRQWRGLAPTQIIATNALGGVALLALVSLAGRPVWGVKEPPGSAARSVVLVIDRSESMALEESDSSRFQQALGFARDRLLPALKSAELPVQAMLFDQSAEAADGTKLSSAEPKGKRTNLAGAIAQA